MHSLLSKGLAGIQPVNVHGIENVSYFPFYTQCNNFFARIYCFKVPFFLFVALQVDVTHVIEGHSSYLQMTLKILEELQLDNCCAVLSTGEVNPEEKKSAM